MASKDWSKLLLLAIAPTLLLGVFGTGSLIASSDSGLESVPFLLAVSPAVLLVWLIMRVVFSGWSRASAVIAATGTMVLASSRVEWGDSVMATYGYGIAMALGLSLVVSAVIALGSVMIARLARRGI